MTNSLILLAAAALVATAPAIQASPLVGIWIEINGPGAARIAACPRTPERLCAIGLDRRTDGRPGRVDGGTVLSNIASDGANRWRGTYHDGKRHLPATLRMVDAQVVEMKVCIFVICQTARYKRSG